jgi:hypothetical protein
MRRAPGHDWISYGPSFVAELRAMGERDYTSKLANFYLPESRRITGCMIPDHKEREIAKVLGIPF